jgi:hypothetical protein
MRHSNQLGLLYMRPAMRTPLESASSVPAVKQVLDLYDRYAPRAEVTFPALRAFSSWLLFVKAAATCDDALTRKCVYNAARTEKAWTGGGLQAPADLTNSDAPVRCFDPLQARRQGWMVPDAFKPDTGPYSCNAPVYKLKGNYGKSLTLADVGKSLSDLK